MISPTLRNVPSTSRPPSRGWGQGPLPGPPAAPQLPRAEAQARRSPGCREQAPSRVCGWPKGPRLAGTRGVHFRRGRGGLGRVRALRGDNSTGRRRWGRTGAPLRWGNRRWGGARGRGTSGGLGRAFGDAGTCDHAREAGAGRGARVGCGRCAPGDGAETGAWPRGCVLSRPRRAT